MFLRTTSMPTPRPDTSVTTSAVEKPGAKISIQTSLSGMLSDTSMPRSRAFFRIFSRFMPLPSSRTSITIEPPWCEAARVKVPVSDLPALIRSSGDSIPWSRLLRTKCVNGSVIFSTRPLSSSVASPCVTRLIFLSSLFARSRNMRGKRLKTVDMGIMRIDITASCKSRVLRSKSASPASNCWLAEGSSARLFCASMA